jgi:hypothetical protein
MAVQKQMLRVEDFERFIQLRENADRLFEFIGGKIVEALVYRPGQPVQVVTDVLPGFALALKGVFAE